ncbi:MAG: lactate utilization protein B [Syntrophobacteraceae bacterium]
MHSRVDQFMETAREEMKNERSQMFLKLFCSGFSRMRQFALSSFPDPEAAESYSRSIRAEVLERMPELLEEFEKKAISRGVKVIWARDAAEANKIILDIARQKGVQYVTKGKSMITEEIGLNEHLIKNGVNVYETDLGEVITQQLCLPPFHLVGPAINVPPEKISDIFLKNGILKQSTTDPVTLGKAARMFLREKFRTQEMGIVGVNMAVAETGSFINVENEGNIRMNKSSPKTLVAIMSLEKVVPTLADAIHMTRMLIRNCTGQKMASYVSFDTGPRKADELDGPEDIYMVILDNGRSEIYKDFKVRDILKCIRCGACMNTCPVYAKIGGYPYGFTYAGPMGQAINPLLLGIENTTDLYRACTLCGSCKETCPAGVDHPFLFLEYRSREIRKKNAKGNRTPLSRLENTMAKISSFGMRHGWAWILGARCVRPVLNFLSRDGYIRDIPFGVKGWFSCRDLMAMPDKTFHDRWKDLQNEPVPLADIGEKEVV